MMNTTIEGPMKFTNLELLAMNALIDGRSLYGVDLEDKAAPDEETTAKQYTQILNGLTEKKILIDNHFTHDGVRIIEVLRTYKTAKEYLFLNELRLSLNGDGSVTLIAKQLDDTYCFYRTWPRAFVEALAAKMPWLDQPETGSPSDPVTYLHEDSWIEDIVDYSMNRRPDTPESGIRDMLIVRHHRSGTAEPLQKLIYYRQANTSHLYNELTRQRRTLPNQEVRQQLQNMLTYSERTAAVQH